MSTTINSTRSWDFDLVALRDEIFAEGGCTLRQAAEMARNSIGIYASYAASWDEQAEALAAAAAQMSLESGDIPTPPATPASRKAAYYASQGVSPVRNGAGYLIASATRNIVHYVGDDGQCTCEAGLHGRNCWHVALVEQSSLRRAA